MQKIGTLSSEGFSLKDLEGATEWFAERGLESEIYKLSSLTDVITEEAFLLVVKNGLSLW